MDTIDGPVKELRVSKQIRILFTVEQAHRIFLVLEGTIKKNGQVDPEAVGRAKNYRRVWLLKRESLPVSQLQSHWFTGS